MKIDKCRLCNSSNFTEWLDLGHHPHSDQFRKDQEAVEQQYPLKVLHCNTCGLSQLSYVVEKEIMYTEDYLYEASITKTASEHWKNFVEDVIYRTGITTGTSLDIGGNDGTLAQKFKDKGFNVVNIDPCKEVADISKKRGITTINAFFTKNADKLFEDTKFDIITGTNVFAHIHDLHSFTEDIKAMLNPDKGVFIFESPYFGEFLRHTEFDTVYHQHLSYLSLKPLIKFFEKFNMEIFDVVFSALHGGAFRCYIANKGRYKITDSVIEATSNENFSVVDLMEFAKRTQNIRQDLMSLLWKLKSNGHTIACVSSPAKGMTLMNYCGINSGLIDFVTEKSKLKIGRFTPGSHIQILSDEALIKNQPDYALLLAWNFADEIIKNNPDYKGKWIIPIPEVRIV